MSTQSVKTRAWQQLQVERNIRPYRMAVLKVSSQTLAPLSTTFEYVFNEFGDFIQGLDPGSTVDGVYVFNLQMDNFKNLDAVQITVNFGATINTGIIIVGGYINPVSAPAQLVINVSDSSGFPFSIDGHVFVTIKEYYGYN
jgi:hypothetical protein